jgi:hypothetical protein
VTRGRHGIKAFFVFFFFVFCLRAAQHACGLKEEGGKQSQGVAGC